MRNKDRISHYHIKLNTMPHSQTSIGYNKKCIGGFLGDPIPNSPNSHHKKNCIADSKENYL